MKIAIIGVGNVGKTLAAGWAKRGHELFLGVQEPGDSPANRGLAAEIPKSQVLGVADAAQNADVIVLTVPWGAVREAVASLGNVQGKILLDCTNPVASWPKLDHVGGKSGGEQVGAWAKGGRVVKIFNSTGMENMANPRYAEGAVTMFYAGDDVEAKRVAHKLAEDLGFDAQDAGALANSYLLEVLASLWGTLAFGQKLGRGIGFRLLRR